MSVILEIHEANTITIVADKREYNSNTDEYSDNSQKLFVIHEQLCIAIAGNVSISVAVNAAINKYKEAIHRILTTDDVTYIIKNLYDNIIEKSPSLLRYPFCCIYAGIGKNGKASLICGKRCKEGYIHSTASEKIFAPADMEIKECNRILVKYYFSDREAFPKNILREISEKSKFVSLCGDKWVFDIQKRQGTLTQI